MRLEIACSLCLSGVVACGMTASSRSQAQNGQDAAPPVSMDAGGNDATHGLDSSAMGDGEAAPTDSGAAPADGGAPRCKRGMGANSAPSAAFAPSASSPGISWWYDWSTASSGGDSAIEFVPMIWGGSDLTATLPAGSRYVLGFNEPNFKAQSNLTPQQAAADWPSVEAAAKAAGDLPIVSPAVNFCGSSTDSSQCSDPAVTDPYTYLKDFFAACPGCQVDYVAVHWYNCDLPSLQAYLEGNVDAGGTLQGFVQFGKPIWLTEFACDPSHSVADQKAYMQAAVPYLEGNPRVFRYSWFSAASIPNAELANADGSLTELGTTYVGLAQSCP
jgi:hypothetical protein